MIRAITALALVAAASRPTAALAAPPVGGGAASGPARQQAEVQYNEGKRLYNAGDYERARLAFKEADAIFQSRQILRYLALTELKLRRPVDALHHAKECVAHPSTAAEAPPTCEALLGTAYGLTGHLSITAPEGGQIKVDGVVLGTAPIKDAVDVDVGHHRVDLVGANLTEAVEAEAGKLTQVAFVAPVVATPGVTRLVGEQPPPPPPPEQPPSPGHVSTTGTIVRWSLSGLAVVGIGMGIGFGAESQSKNNAVYAFQASHPGPCAAAGSATCSQYTQLQSEQSTNAALSVAFYSVGAAAAVGALAAWIFWPKHHENTAAVSVVPDVGRGTAGLQISSQF
jgi:hypothetical protein